MLLSIVVYTLTALILYLLAANVSLRDQQLYSKTGRTLSMSSWEIVLSLIVFSFIAGARYNVGIDYPGYLQELKSLEIRGWLFRETFESGFVFITGLFAKSGLHFFFYFAFWAFFQLFFIYKACENEKYLLPYIALCIMLGPYFLDWMNGMRQCLVMCYFVFSIRYIENKRWLPFIIGVMIAFTIHRSAVIMLPFFVLGFKQVTLKSPIVNYIILFVCIVLGSNPQWISITQGVEKVLFAVGYERYSENYGSFIELSNFHEMAWGPSRLSILFTELIIIYFYPKMREFYNNFQKLDICFFIFFIGVCFYNLFVNTSHILLRPVGYFTIFTLPLSAYTLYYLKKTKNKVWFSVLSILIFSYVFFVVYKSVYRPTEYSEFNLYKFYFFK